MPPPPAARSETELWREAYRRADGLKPLVQGDLASVDPGPLPQEPGKPTPPPGGPSEAAAPAAGAPPPPGSGSRVFSPTPAVPGKGAEAKPSAGAAKPAARASVPAVRVQQKFTVENGMPSGRVTALFVDDDDVWVGTADAGVARYNFHEGNWFVTKVEDGLASNRISDVTKYKGKVYVATQDGVNVWDGVSWTAVEKAGDSSVKLLNVLFRTHDGVLWMAARTMFGGLVTFDGEKWKDRSGIRPGTVLNNVSDFTFSGNTLWIGTTNRGLLRFDGKDWAAFTVTEGLASNFVYTLGAKGDNCYVGGCCGLTALEEGSWRVYDVAEGMPHSTVNSVVVDGDLVWLGSKKGLGLFDGFNFTNFYIDSGLTDDRITSIFVKGTDVWVGTANGLNRMVKAY